MLSGRYGQGLRTEAINTVVRELGGIDPADPEGAHKQADEILLRLVPPEIAEAYRQLADDRCYWWAYA